MFARTVALAALAFTSTSAAAQEGVYYRVRNSTQVVHHADIYFQPLEPGSSSVKLIDDLTGDIWGFDLDQANGKLYWIRLDGTGYLERANLDGSNVETLVSGLQGLRNAWYNFTLQVVPSLGRVFWSISGRRAGDPGRISSANLDGSDVRDILNPSNAYPGGFVVDSLARRMIWEVYDNQPPYSPSYPFHGIRSANLDGSDIRDLLDFDAYDMTPQWFEARRMAIDYSRDKLHFSASQGDHYRMNLDGTGVELIIDQVEWEVNGFGIDPVGDRLVWLGRIFHDPYPDVIGYASMDGSDVGTLFMLALPDQEYHDGVMAFGSQQAITVTTTGDEEDADVDDGLCDVDPATDGLQCTLRAAIQTANADADTNRIEFDIGPGVPVIGPKSKLPKIIHPVTIDGHAGPADRIRISGAEAGSEASGLEVQSSDVTIRGLWIEGFSYAGINVFGVVDMAEDCRIGGPGDGEGNYLTGNRTGIRIEWADRLFIQGNFIGVSPSDHEILMPNERAGIEISLSGEVTIGGETEDEGNLVMDGVTVSDDSGPISLEQNIVAVPPELLTGDPGTQFRLPFESALAGPECRTLGATGADGLPSVPQIMQMTTAGLWGYADPNVTVSAYKVLDTGTRLGRYFARHVEWTGRTTADASGRFEIGKPLEFGERYVVQASGAKGISELSQASYPIVIVPGIGGSWIEDTNGRDLWLPDGWTDGQQNESMARMILTVDGVPAVPGGATGVLETAFGLASPSPYGPMLDAFEAAGWAGDTANADTSGNDIWRVWYDWRLSLGNPHARLVDTVNLLTRSRPWTGGRAAVSCQVDLVGHSMGGLVASALVRNDTGAGGRARVHRFVSMAAPYLGSSQVVAAHSFGYIFGLEEGAVYGWGWDIDWNVMLNLTDNMPSAYVLMPSRNYYEASLIGVLGLLPDFSNNPLGTYDEVKTFLGGKRSTGSGANLGLERNTWLWSAEQAWHDRFDDWRGWTGPPHVFRLVGNRPVSTNTNWYLGNRFRQTDGARQMFGDPLAVVEYRNRLAPIQDAGDGTVPIESASLGRIGGGSTDFSGVDSPWIEEFEQYACLHMDIVNPSSCPGAVERAIEIVRSAYRVLSEDESKRSARAPTLSDDVVEVFYLFASAPVAVVVEDDQGRRTGSVHPDTLGKIIYAIPGAHFTSTGVTTVLSLPAGSAYSVTATASERETTVQLVRMRPAGGDVLENHLFPDHTIQARGSLRWNVSAGGSAAEIEADDNADGSFESTVLEVATVSSSSTAPAIPIPEPLSIHEEILTGSPNPVVEIVLGDVGGASWDWSVGTTTNWIAPEAASGQTPSTIRLTLDDSALGIGTHEGSVEVTLSHGAYAVQYTVPVVLGVSDVATLKYVLVSPERVELLPGATRQFVADGFDQFGDPFATTVTWSAGGGSINATGLYTAGTTGGTYAVRATAPGGPGLFDEATVVIPSLTGLEDPGIPHEWGLPAPYPNPFAGRLTVVLEAPEAAPARVEVFDMMGRRLGLLVDGPIVAGRHRLSFKADTLPPGVYVVRASARGWSRIRTIVHLR